MSAVTSAETQVHPTAIVERGAELGAGVTIGPYCIVGPHVKLGDRVTLLSHVSLAGHTSIGEDTVIYPFAALGHPPQDTSYRGEETTLSLGARSTVRENVTMNVGTARGRGATTVGAGGFYMCGAHIGHDCVVGDEVILVNNSNLGGHVVVGDKVILGGISAVHQYCRLGRHAFVGGGAAVTGDVIPYGMVDNHGHLAGLNLVGLKRRGYARETIHDLRSAYRLLFSSEGAFQERVDDVERLFASRAEVMEIVAFIRADSSRGLCTPNAS